MKENYLTMSEIEEAKGNRPMAFDYFKKYANLKDSIINVEILGDINRIQRMYEISKTTQQIEKLEIDRQFKENTIFYLRIILGVLLLFIVALVVAVYQKKKLKKYSKININEKTQKELLNKIMLVMEDVQIICDPEFTIDKLAELVQSNYVYVSHIINKVIKKNFRSFLNGYRIKKAQSLFLELDAKKYTIDSIARQVGFNSPNTFRNTFKEIIGVTPSAYLESFQREVTPKEC